MMPDALVPPQKFVGTDGRLGYADGRSTPCRFEIRQADDASVVVLCQHGQPSWVLGEAFENRGGPERLSGWTDSGAKISIEGEFLQTNAPPDWEGSANGAAVAYIVNGPGVLISGDPGDVGPFRAYFHLINLIFTGNEVVHAPIPGGGDSWSLSALSLDIGGRPVTITLVPGHADAERRLRKSRGAAVTCTLETPLQTCAELGEVDVLVSRLCALFSLASGCRVTWASREVRAGSCLVDAEIRNSATRPYSRWTLIDTGTPSQLKGFIESVYPSYVALEQDYELARVMDARVDALTSGFLETKATIGVVVGEYLCKRFGRLHGRGSSTLEVALRRFASELRPGLRGKDLRKFVKTRNALVHEMRFRTASPAKEHRTVVHTVDRLVLALLGYNGPFIDCRTWSPMARLQD